MNNNLDATVFVYRHRDTSEVKALYHDSALGMTYQTDYEHVATLEPRMWIEHHFDDAIKEREACAKVAEDPQHGLSAWRARENIAAAIRARGNP